MTAVETNPLRVDLGFEAFDADNHYYEAEDAFIRHIPRAMAKRCMQWAEIDGKKRLLVGGRVNRFIPNPTFNPVSKPGALDAYFRGRVSGDDMRQLFGELEPIPAAYRERSQGHRDAHLARHQPGRWHALARRPDVRPLLGAPRRGGCVGCVPCR